MADKKWIEKLRGSMGEYESSPPEGLWEAVEAGIPRRQAVSPWWWALAGAAAALVAVLLLWRPGSGVDLLTANESDINEVSGQLEEIVDPEQAAAPEVAVVQEHSAPVVRVEPIASAKPGLTAALEETPDAGQTAFVPAAAETSETPEASAVPEAQTAPEPPETPETSEIPESPETPDSGDAAGQIQLQPLEPSFPGTPEPRSRSRQKPRLRVSAGLLASNVPTGPVSNHFQEVGMPMMFDASTRASSSLPSAATLARNKITDNEFRHEISASFGFILNFSITEQWAVESGIQTSTLHTWGQSGSGSVSSTINTSTTYTGYPLQAVFTPWRGRHLSAYVSAGPMLEHATRTRWSRTSSLGDYKLSNDSGTDYIDDWLLSFGLNVGVQWEFDGWGALFLQPGFRRRFPGEGTPESYFKEKPQTFNLGAGFRVSF